MTFIEHVRATAAERMAALLDGVDRVHILDFPDHENIGDSAIFAGEYAYLQSRTDIVIDGIDSYATFTGRCTGSEHAHFIHGGGNVGGLYPQHDRGRERVASALAPTSILIQAPQTVWFVDGAEERAFHAAFDNRPGFRVGARDRESLARLGMPGAILSPDAFHLYPDYVAADPVEDIIVLAREDIESVSRRPDAPTFDWPAARLRDRALHRGRALTIGHPVLQDLVRPSAAHWVAQAEARVQQGLALVSHGNTVVTDRLHGMLLALHAGRRVVAVDNTSRKLSTYYSTWFEGTDAPVRLAPDLATGIELAREWAK